MNVRKIISRVTIGLLVLLTTGCASFPQGVHYYGPPQRPLSVETYYKVKDDSVTYSNTVVRTEKDFTLNRMHMDTYLGPCVVDYFQRHEVSENIILVFPILGGKNALADYFAEYFADRGFDTAIVHRNNDFKRPKNFHRIEEIFRDGIIRDRIIISFFEREFGKTTFGSFGLSRGAINVAMTAGVDSRLQYNVIAMGGSDLVGILRESAEPGVKRFRRKTMKHLNITEEEFFARLEQEVKTDPKFLSKYINAEDTLMFIALFDECVPAKYGLQLREEIGDPKTVFLMSGHLSGIAFTQVVKLVPPIGPLCIFPLDYVETESVSFYRKSFDTGGVGVKGLAYQVLHLPFAAIKVSLDTLFGGNPAAAIPSTVFAEAEREEVAD